MKKIALAALLALSFMLPLQAQTFTARTEPLKLDFGYPRLRVLDDLQFLDENENNRIDPSESSLITFSVENTTQYPARNVVIRPQELNKIAGIQFESEIAIGEIPPFESRRVQAGIIASSDIQPGTASFVFAILEDGTNQNISVVYAVGLLQEVKPE